MCPTASDKVLEWLENSSLVFFFLRVCVRFCHLYLHEPINCSRFVFQYRTRKRHFATPIFRQQQ